MTRAIHIGRKRGSIMVEFTLVLPILVSLFLGVVFFGYDFHVYNRLEESVRAGARFASMQTYDAYHSNTDPAPTQCASCEFPVTSGPFLDSVRKIVAYGCDPATESASGCTATPIIEGVNPANVAVTLGIVNWIPRFVSVSITGVSLSTPVGSVTLNGKPVTRFPYMSENYKPPLPPKK